MAEKRLIDAYDLAETIENMKITVAGKPARWDDAKVSVLREIAQAPDVDAVEVKHGEWIILGDCDFQCPECGFRFTSPDDISMFKFCRCGLKMDLNETI